MATLTQNYQTALREFEALTNKSAVTLKSKGKEAGLKKLKSIFQKSKSLGQLIESLEKAVAETEKPKADAAKALKALQGAYDKLNQGLKLNIAEYEAQGRDLGPADRAMKDGFSVFVNRLEMIRKTGKLNVEQRALAFAKGSGKANAASVAASELKQCYLTMKKAIEETEGSMKMVLAKPTRENVAKAFCSSTNVRSIGAAVTMYKQNVLKKDPSIADKLRADPVHLLSHINDLSQNKGMVFWEGKLGMAKPGWEPAAKKVAQHCLDQMKNWRILADELKAAAQ